MMTSALVFVVLALLTFGIMLVTAAGARPSQRRDSARRQAEENGNALLQSWLTPEQDMQWQRDHAFESPVATRARATGSLNPFR
jgi:hypothetical protein